MDPEDEEEDFLPDDAPPPRATVTLPLREIVGERRGYDTPEDVAESIARKGRPAPPMETMSAGRRTARDLAELLDAAGTIAGVGTLNEQSDRARSVPVVGGMLGDYADSGTASATGAVQGGTLGYADEIGGGVSALGELASGGDLDEAGEAYVSSRDRMRGIADADREESPWAYGFGELAGGAAVAPLLPSIGGGRAATALGRVGNAALEGLTYGTAGGFGASEGDLGTEEGRMRAAEDTLMGGAGGLVMGGAGGAVGEGVGAGTRALRRYASGADRARVASVIGTGSAPLSARAERDVANLPGGIEGAADFIRREGIGTRMGDVTDAAERAAAAAERTGARVGEFNSEIDAALPDGIPVERFTGALEGVSDELSLNPYTRRTAPRIDDTAGAWRDSAADAARASALGSPRRAGPLPEGVNPEAVGSEAAREAMGELRRNINWAADPAAAGADLDAHRALRRVYDEVAGEVLPPERAAGFRPARDDHARASVLERYSGDAAARAARSPGTSLRGEIGAAALDAVPGGFLGRRLAAEGLSGLTRRRGAIEATTAETARAILESAPARLGEYGPVMANALRRGADVFIGTHAALMRADPDYAATVEAASAEAPPDWAADFVEEDTTDAPDWAAEFIEE